MLLDFRTRALLAEIEEIRARFPNQSLAVGYGEDHSYRDTNVRANPVLQGDPYLIDTVAVTDAQPSGRGIPEATRSHPRRVGGTLADPRRRRTIRAAHVLSLQGAVFDPAFRDAFRANYSVVDRTPHLDVWRYAGKLKTDRRPRRCILCLTVSPGLPGSPARGRGT